MGKTYDMDNGIEIRRTYAIGLVLARRIEEEARRRGWDKSEVVQLALRLGMPEIEAAPIRDSVDVAEEQLRALRDGSIKTPSAKRREK